MGFYDALKQVVKDELKGSGNKDFTTLETDLESVLAQLDITLSALRDALQGGNTKDFSTLETDVESVLTQLDVLLSTRAADSSFQNVSNSQSFTDPAANPTLTLDCNGRNTAGFWVAEPTGGITVQIYSSIDNATWRTLDTYTTDADGNSYDTLSIATRYIKVEIQNTALGSYTIELSASR